VHRTTFIVGAPRSGTTLMGLILDLHPLISCWVEPYFVIDHHFRSAPNDCRVAEDATSEVKTYILNSFDHFRRRRGCRMVVDKSPRNGLKMPFLSEVFPEGKFIHVLRDGRDATLSIHRRWLARENFFRDKRSFLQMTIAIKNYLDRQTLFAHKLAALHFEVGSLGDVLRGQGSLQRVRWEGRRGWGPRFEGWQSMIDRVSSLGFSSLQWAKCVEAVVEQSRSLHGSQFLEVRYEEFLEQPKETLLEVFDFLQAPLPEDFMSRLPLLRTHNYGKWKKAYSDAERMQIGPILHPLLVQLGYADSDSWYKNCQGDVSEQSV